MVTCDDDAGRGDLAAVAPVAGCDDETGAGDLAAAPVIACHVDDDAGRGDMAPPAPVVACDEDDGAADADCGDTATWDATQIPATSTSTEPAATVRRHAGRRHTGRRHIGRRHTEGRMIQCRTTMRRAAQCQTTMDCAAIRRAAPSHDPPGRDAARPGQILPPSTTVPPLP